MCTQERLTRWRLLRGKDAQESMAHLSLAGCTLSTEQLERDEALEAIYAERFGARNQLWRARSWLAPIREPSFIADLVGKLSKLGMPCFGCTPDRLPDLLASVLKGQVLQ